MLVLAYPVITPQLFLIFDCVPVEGRSFLRVDLRLQCDGSQYYATYMLCVALIAFYVVGLPCFVAVCLYQRRDAVDIREFIDSLHAAHARACEWEEHVDTLNTAWERESDDVHGKEKGKGMGAGITSREQLQRFKDWIVDTQEDEVEWWQRPQRYRFAERLPGSVQFSAIQCNVNMVEMLTRCDSIQFDCISFDTIHFIPLPFDSLLIRF